MADLENLRHLYRMMLLIRQTELKLGRLFADGEIPGFIHLSVGQEAISAGVCSALTNEDTVASTHRGHGHALAKGIALDAFFLELLGREEGMCRGRGGSMHVADMSIGMLGANGIVGAGIPIALGSALAHSVHGNDAIAVAFFGDGAIAEGVVHESINLAALWKLPLLLVCENNGWAEFSPTHAQIVPKLEDLAGAYGITYVAADGNDVEAVAQATTSLMPSLRGGAGPAILECHTTRWRGHYEGDPQRYREDGDPATLEVGDPLVRTRARLVSLGEDETTLASLDADAIDLVDRAVERARHGSSPLFMSALADVYADPFARMHDEEVVDRRAATSPLDILGSTEAVLA